jgi:membrane protease YdiL (CAAX protease family)
VSTMDAAVIRRFRWRDLTLAMLVPVVGVAFNLLRLGLRLDRGTLPASLLAFGLLAVGGALMGRLAGLERARLGVTMPRPVPAVVGGAMAAVVLTGAAFMTAPLTRPPDIAQLAGGLALFGLGTAPAEELLFRGVLYGLVDRTAGGTAAIVVSSVAFAAVHVPVYGVASVPLAVSAGLLLSWLRWWSRSLLPPVVVHAIADLSLLWL